MTTIAQNIQSTHQIIRASCHKFGRDVDGIALIAVSKTFDLSAVLEAVQAGQRAFGENYIQEGVDKIIAARTHPACAHVQLEWHCIGPVQSNKTRLVATYFDWVHTVDRVKVAQRLQEQRPITMPPLQVCLQVNTDASPTKSGIAPDAVYELACAVLDMPHLQLRGLMTIPEPHINPQEQLAEHARTRVLFDKVRNQLQASHPQAAHHFDTLSMGMSKDLEMAIAAGSTMVRIGSAIFGKRDVA